MRLKTVIFFKLSLTQYGTECRDAWKLFFLTGCGCQLSRNQLTEQIGSCRWDEQAKAAEGSCYFCFNLQQEGTFVSNPLSNGDVPVELLLLVGLSSFVPSVLVPLAALLTRKSRYCRCNLALALHRSLHR